MAQRGRKNQKDSSCQEHASMIRFRSANSHTGPQLPSLHPEAGQMAASDYVPIFFKNRLHLAGRPQMSPDGVDAPSTASMCQSGRC
jgi:hypothetical protein